MPVATGATNDSVEEILENQDCGAIPESEVAWFVEPPIMPVFFQPEPEAYPEEPYGKVYNNTSLVLPYMSTSGNPNEGDLPHLIPPMREVLR